MGQVQFKSIPFCSGDVNCAFGDGGEIDPLVGWPAGRPVEKLVEEVAAWTSTFHGLDAEKARLVGCYHDWSKGVRFFSFVGQTRKCGTRGTRGTRTTFSNETS